ATSFKNPLNSLAPLFTPTPRASSVAETQKAISTERIHEIGRAVEEYSVVNARMPSRLQDLMPMFISPMLLRDPWGNQYKYYNQGGDKFLVTGYDAHGRADTDLFLSQALDSSPVTPANAQQKTGGIQLID